MKIIFLLLVLPFTLFSECCCCCGDDDNPQSPGTGGGSSDPPSCVSMTPSECEGIKSSASAAVDQILISANAIYDSAQSDLYSAIFSLIDVLEHDLLEVYNILDLASSDANYEGSYLTYSKDLVSSALSYAKQSSDYYSQFGNGNLFVSNVNSGVSSIVNGGNNPFFRFRTLTNYIQRAYSPLTSLSVTNSLLQQKISSADSSLRSIESRIATSTQELFNFYDLVIANMKQIYSAKSAADEAIASINCSGCSSSGGSGGGGGGGSTVVDLTPLVNAINAHKEQMIDLYDDLKSYIYNFFRRFNDANSFVLSNNAPTYQSYRTSGENWFSRMETLLFTVAYPNFAEDDEEPYSPDASNGLSSLLEDNASNSSALSNTVSSVGVDRQGSVLFRLKTCIQNLYDSFSFCSVSSASVQGGFGDSGITFGDFHVDPIYIDSGVANIIDNILTVVRYCFEAFYYISAVLMVLGFFFVVFRGVRSVVQFQLQLYASLFGSSS